MRILAIGDVTSPAGIEHLEKNLWRIRGEKKIDFCVVNGENASFITGISPELADRLFAAGADVITGGNHTLRNNRIFEYIEEKNEIIRPINFGGAVPGKGYSLVDVAGYRFLVINAMGNVHIEPTLNSPYPYIDALLDSLSGKYDFSILDIHAEATGEKAAIGYAYDGKINVIFGTHTHVQTADEIILPEGTGYISDVGMCGESGGVLGMDPAVVVERMRNKIAHRFIVSRGACRANGAIFEIDATKNRVTSIERITF